MKKIVILIFALFLVTGCSVRYEATINEDLSITEKAKITGTESFFDSYYKTTKKHVLQSFIDRYESLLIEEKYQYELKENDNDPYVLVDKKYSSINEYINNSKMFNDYFDEIKYTENGNIKRIETFGFNENEADNQDRFYVEELSIAITCPYKVKNHSAAKVNEQTNTYYYKIGDENTKIMLEFDASQKFNPNEKKIITLIVLCVITVSSWIAIYISNKKKKKNTL